jgi:hypothetical protein
MKKLLVVVVIVALIGVPAFLWVKGSVYAVSPEHPLGEWELVDGWLLEKGFEKAKGETDLRTRMRFQSELEEVEMFGIGSQFRSACEKMGNPTCR